jgi:hypothetical protein
MKTMMKTMALAPREGAAPSMSISAQNVVTRDARAD